MAVHNSSVSKGGRSTAFTLRLRVRRINSASISAVMAITGVLTSRRCNAASTCTAVEEEPATTSTRQSAAEGGALRLICIGVKPAAYQPNDRSSSHKRWRVTSFASMTKMVGGVGLFMAHDLLDPA